MDELLAAFWGLFPPVSDKVRFMTNLIVAWTIVAGSLVLLNSVLSRARLWHRGRDRAVRYGTETAATRQVLQSYADRPHSDGIAAVFPQNALRRRDRGLSERGAGLPKPIPSADGAWRRSAAGAPLRAPECAGRRTGKVTSPIPKSRSAGSGSRAKRAAARGRNQPGTAAVRQS